MEPTTAPFESTAPNFCTICGANWQAGVTTPECAACKAYSDSLRPPETVRAHRYPVWLLLFAAAVVGAAVYSLRLLPPFWTAARDMHRAEAAMDYGNRRKAERLLGNVLGRIPSSKSARIDMAVLLLRSSSDSDHRRGLNYLVGLKLEKDDWARVSAVLPAKYQGLFHSTKE